MPPDFKMVPLDCEDWNRIVKWVYKFYEVLSARNF